MSRLDEALLEKIQRRGNRIVCRCPACAEAGHDKTGNHLSVQSSGAFTCVQFPGAEGREHRKRIFELVGIRGYETLDQAIAAQEDWLSMKATRRDSYNDQFVMGRFDDAHKRKKVFRPFHHNGASWLVGDPAGKLPLFNLAELRERPTDRVYLVEGEKCVCALRDRLGLLATTSAHGAKSPHKTDWQPMAGSDVVILADNDADGLKYAQTVAGILTELMPPAKVKIVKLPGLPKKGDVVDWLNARDGQTPENIAAELLQLVGNAEEIHEEKTAEPDEPEPEQTKAQPSSEKPKKEKTKKKAKKQSAASRLVAFVTDSGRKDASGRSVGPFKLFHDPHDRAFARYQAKDHVEVWPVESAKFKKLLARLYYKNTGQIINRNALSDAVTTLAGLAVHENPQEETFLRVAPYGDYILIDLCDPKWRVVLVTAEGWQLLELSPIAFVRTGSMLSLPEPHPGGGSIEPLWELLNVTEAQRPLVTGAILNAYHPYGPYFVSNYLGEHGTAKTTAARFHRQLIDPNQNPLRSPPREENDLFAQAVNNRCVALDNLSYLPLWLSDALCRVATGGGLSKRVLYTDTDELSLEIKRPVIINGIEDVATRPDLADRVLQIELETIPKEHRITEKVLRHEFEQAHPVIFTAILDAVSMALRTLPTLKMPPLPRMADATEWATAGETAFGFERGTFLKAYQRNLDESAEAAVEANLVSAAIRKLVETYEEWSGEPSELLEALNVTVSEKIQKQDDWPANSQRLGQILRRIAPALRRAGIGYDRRKSGSRIIRLFKKTAEDAAETDADTPDLHVVNQESE
jgi:putative DNA primase/helicase